MIRRKKRQTPFTLVKTAIEAIENKKGESICYIDLRKIQSSVCDFFVICHGNSRPHVEAITHSIIKAVMEKTGEEPWHIEGITNAQWILLDYLNVVVHIFHKDARTYYRLEEMWADAGVIKMRAKRKRNEDVKM
ncbi:MAG: ribosome silencing factor [Bacteroidetes bacterium]|nr:ribosome silencing factor [Bacteroidota bacterium]